MTIDSSNNFFDQSTLIDRLTEGLLGSNKEVVFVVGAPLTADHDGIQGVANVDGVVSLIRNEFTSSAQAIDRFDSLINTSDNKYQESFKFLHGRRGQDAANIIIKKAVLLSNKTTYNDIDSASKWPDDQLAVLERDLGGWNLTRGVESLGKLLSVRGTPFTPLVITSNFDPLVGISIQLAGQQSWRTSLHGDGNFSQSQALGCQVLHIHGFWWGTDTLHTQSQLLQTRPALLNSLSTYLENKTIVVVAYSGWRDIFTTSLQNMVSNLSRFPDVIWTFYDDKPFVNSYLEDILRPGLDRGRVTFYSGIDCHTLFPALHNFWKDVPQLTTSAPSARAPTIESPIPSPTPVRNNSSDRPPNIDVWVGRRDELRALETTQAKVVIISGIGGQGKSTLAAHYLHSISGEQESFSWWDWRDCKEEGERLRTQIVAASERMKVSSDSHINFDSLTDADIVETFVSLSYNQNAVFVFDNVDGYVDLENGVFDGILDLLVREFSRSATKSRLVITCRPNVKYDLISVMSIPLGGLSLPEALELFDRRAGARKTDPGRVEVIHTLTKGHAFWIDMLAVQIERMPMATLDSLIEDIRRGRESPVAPLRPIWQSLNDRQKTVLRAMAEIMRPESDNLLSAVVANRMNYKNFSRSLRALVNMNLVVVKRERNAPDLYDLHPLVRQFVRTIFNRPERAGFIDFVLVQYGNIIKAIGNSFGVHMPFQMLERWSEKAELEVEAGRFGEALKTLGSARNALLGGGHTEEFVRVGRKLFQSNDWTGLSGLKNFDAVCCDLIIGLNDLDERDDSDDMLEKFLHTIGVKSARYIRYCDVRAYVLWSRGVYSEAVEWASKGVDLKANSDVDTEYDCSNTLALARRDGGDPETAIKYFQNDEELEAYTNPDSFEIGSSSALGNVGRCLQFMGRPEDALICYKKSAQILESDDSVHRVRNQAFARQWVAEVYEDQGDIETAFVFYQAAADLLVSSKPSLARELRGRALNLPLNGIRVPSTADEVRRRVSNWIRH